MRQAEQSRTAHKPANAGLNFQRGLLGGGSSLDDRQRHFVFLAERVSKMRDSSLSRFLPSEDAGSQPRLDYF
jgi:hypothetical protein